MENQFLLHAINQLASSIKDQKEEQKCQKKKGKKPKINKIIFSEIYKINKALPK